MAVGAGPRRHVEPALALAALTQVIWALGIVVTKWSIGAGWEPLAYTCLRFGGGAILFAIYVIWREGSLRVDRSAVPRVLVCAAIGIFANQLAFMQSAQHTTAATISLMMAAAPAAGAVITVIAGQERIGPLHWAGVGLAVVGVALILEGSGGDLDLTSLQGDLWALGAAFTWALYSVLVRPLVSRYSASRISALMLLAGAPMIWAVGWPQVAEQDWGALTALDWAALLYASVVALLVTNVLWFGAISRLGAARVTALMPLQPVAGVVLGVVLLGEQVTPLALVGGTLVIVAVLATTRPRQPAPA